MSETATIPTVPVNLFKRTKIIATVGPATNNYESILAMAKAGVNGFRLNFSHGDYEEREQQIKWIRRASQEFGKPVAIIQDLQGPKIRLGDFSGVISVSKGQELRLGYKVEHEPGGVLPMQYDLSKKVKRGERVLLYDGKVKTIVTSVRDGQINLRVENDGILTQRKGINVPDTDFGGDVITKKDRQDIVFGAEQQVDFVAMSFVQTAEDVAHLRRLLKNLGSKSQIISKVETKSAIENLEAIVEASDAVMVARGDLATETLPESVPVVQREIIRLCLHHEKLSIVATQMLASMMEQPEPTRAEVSDVATAVIVGADCVMLSDETAVGRYPIESIDFMKRIIRYTQANTTVHVQFDRREQTSVAEAVSATVTDLAEKVKAVAIVVETTSGQTARYIAAWRPKIPIIAITSENSTAHQLALLYGTKSFVRQMSGTTTVKLTEWLRTEGLFKKGDHIVTASGKYPGLIGGTDTVKVRVLE